MQMFVIYQQVLVQLLLQEIIEKVQLQVDVYLFQIWDCGRVFNNNKLHQLVGQIILLLLLINKIGLCKANKAQKLSLLLKNKFFNVLFFYKKNFFYKIQILILVINPMKILLELLVKILKAFFLCSLNSLDSYTRAEFYFFFRIFKKFFFIPWILFGILTLKKTLFFI